MITQQRLHEILDYDPNTGEFRWKISTNHRIKIGQIAGSGPSRKKARYSQIMIDGKLYMTHRLAWLFVYGQFPNKEIDHKDGNRLNNKINNLRELSSKENSQNKQRYKSNKTGITGVWWIKEKKKWGSKISNTILGYYEDIWDAICARKSAELVYQPLRVVSNQ